MKTAISIPDPLFKMADALANRLNVSRSELYATAIRALVEEHDDAAKRRALDDVYGQESSALPSGAARAQGRVVSKWEP